MRNQVAAEAADVAKGMGAANAPVETVSLKPKKTNVAVGFTSLVWAPCKVAEGKDPEPAW